MPSDNHNPPREDSVASQADTRIRELLSSLPVSTAGADYERRVLTKIHRRKITIRSTFAASLIVLLVAGWVISRGDQTPQRPGFAMNDRSPVDSPELPSVSLNDVELFSSAFQGLPSPVVQLDAIENEAQAWLSYLSLLEETMEKK